MVANAPKPVDPSKDGNKALLGTPMGEYMLRRDLLRQAITAIHEETCCGDPEYCVYAVCVIHPECGGNDTLRTSPPDENNVSEFWCFDCEEFFDASNP